MERVDLAPKFEYFHLLFGEAKGSRNYRRTGVIDVQLEDKNQTYCRVEETWFGSSAFRFVSFGLTRINKCI